MRAECCNITGLAGKMEFQRTYLEEKDKRDMWADCAAVIRTTRAFRMDTSATLVALANIAYPSKESSLQGDKKDRIKRVQCHLTHF